MWSNLWNVYNAILQKEWNWYVTTWTDFKKSNCMRKVGNITEYISKCHLHDYKPKKISFLQEQKRKTGDVEEDTLSECERKLLGDVWWGWRVLKNPWAVTSAPDTTVMNLITILASFPDINLFHVMIQCLWLWPCLCLWAK